MKTKLLLITLGCVLMTACGVEKQILEDILIAEVVGYDDAGDHKIKGTVVVNVPQLGEEANLGKEVYEAISHDVKATRQQENSKTTFPIVGGRLSVILYSEELAGKGLNDYVDTYRRDPMVGRNLYLAVVHGRADDVVKIEPKLSKTPGVQVKELIEQNIRTNLPNVDLHHYLYASHGKGIDPVMPLLETAGERVRVKGIALFKKDRYIGKYISYEDGFLFKVLSENFKLGSYEIKLKDNDFIDINNVQSHVHYDILHANQEPKVRIEVKIKASILEVQGYDLGKPLDVKNIENKAEQAIEKKLNKMLTMFQENNIDPIAMGDIARSKTRNFNRKHWEEVYPHIPIDLAVDIEMIQTGIAE
ncbi:MULTISPECIES: Ger(x)C family spore germination protein [unclassified Peribacillus]|uniref:Ger(x)C family spore germination protein n=1 Tax=unclassified Peribacillus TaxID=2675266 RepID=UPI0019112EC7|nr:MULTISPECIES: Ger(x)C family spore germination protein [unclassified Peribacillus]MBK5443860.1 Ger(x)C family spore germination protein [Peribacillus sp. TH24]MBK5461421.1 Ger(x)C family spore germination protein [Peribacillus sp. TH27]MBK5485258.1 Ger(x)C family spore germination protein [Peribacillus sp. TH16]MBK5499560.1 Ger(x)C family spore germination protein [Peribacillus sp. TH14]WMX55352.1 Ger(x)C family spore germination protein [Peribacillus sp. R9-11]